MWKGLYTWNVRWWYSQGPDTTGLRRCFCAFFVGTFGIHRFYVGKVASGLFYLITFGVFGIGWIIDLIMILTGSFMDRYGLPLKHQEG